MIESEHNAFTGRDKELLRKVACFIPLLPFPSSEKAESYCVFMYGDAR